jgi:hypothetical protein
MARKYKYQINSKRGIVKAVERPAGTTPIRESKGAYDPKATYTKGDTVIYGGLYYTATTGQGVPGEGDGWEISGIVSAKGVTLSIRLSKPVLDVSEGTKTITATATATLGGQDITAGLPADGWRWTWRGKELSGETNSGIILPDIPLEVGQYPVRVTHKLFGTYAEVQVVRVDVTTKLRAELEEALEGLRKSTGDEQAAMAEILGKVNKTLTSLQEQVDKEVSNWFYPGPPAPDKEPESEWVTNQDKYRHIGDTYTSVDESGEYMGKSWRYTTEYKWQEIHDTLISKALAVAAKAQTTADGKSTTYYTQPSRYSVGDSWVLSADTTVGGKVYKKGTMLFANSSSDVYVGSHWADILKYIDSAKLDADLRASEAKSKEAWEAYAAAKASNAGAEAIKTAKEYADAQAAAYEERTKAYADKILTEKEQALIAAADAKAAAAETRAKAYADGKITATEQLAIDKAQKAYDDAVKRAKELVGEIQVGGRNLAIMSRMIPGYLYGEGKHGNPGDKDYKVIQYKDFVYDPTYYEWDGATPLTYRIESVPEGRTGMPIIHYHDKDKRFIGWEFDWSYQPPGYTKTLTPKPETAYIRIGFVIPQAVVKIERGTVATDWTPAPEDVRAAIEEVAQAKAELAETKSKAYADDKITATEQLAIDKAQKAYDDAVKRAEELDSALKSALSREIDAAKEQADKAQTSTESLRGYVDGAFRDGVVDDAEAKAIKTYINEVDAQWQSALGAYEKVYTNALLTGASKTALLDCKTTLAGKVSDLTQYIATAIGDGRATTAEVDGVNTRYNAYKIALKDFQKALKEAEDFIRSKGAGGKFLGEAVELGGGGYVKLYNKVDGQYAKAGDTVKMVTDGSNYDITWKKDKIYILGLKDGKYGDELVWEQLTGEDGAPGRDGRDGVDGKDGAPGKDADPAEIRELKSGLADANTSISALQTAKEEIEKGKLSISDLPKNLKWIYDAFHHGETQIEGGLILSKYIGLSNSSDKVTSYISGEDGAGAHMLAAGVSSLADTDAKSYLDHDGRFHLSDEDTFLDFDPDGKFALTLFGGKLNIPGILYAGYFTESSLRSLGGPIAADYSFGQLSVVAKSRYEGEVVLRDESPNSYYYGQGYKDAWRLNHYAGTKNYVPVVIGGLQTAIQTLEADYFEFVIQTQPQPRPLGSIYILIIGENKARYE